MAASVDGPPVLHDGVLEPRLIGQVGVVADDDLQCALVEVRYVTEQREVGGDGVPVGVPDCGGVFDLCGEKAWVG